MKLTLLIPIGILAMGSFHALAQKTDEEFEKNVCRVYLRHGNPGKTGIGNKISKTFFGQFYKTPAGIRSQTAKELENGNSRSFPMTSGLLMTLQNEYRTAALATSERREARLDVVRRREQDRTHKVSVGIFEESKDEGSPPVEVLWPTREIAAFSLEGPLCDSLLREKQSHLYDELIRGLMWQTDFRAEAEQLWAGPSIDFNALVNGLGVSPNCKGK